MDTTEVIKVALQAAAVAIALFTLGKGTLEFIAQGKQKRSERFLAMRERFAANPDFARVRELIEANDPTLAKHAYQHKRAYLNFFEEIALMINSGLLKERVAHYVFGYSIIRCWDSEHFWTRGVDRQSMYWSAFRDLAKRMKRCESEFAYSRRMFSA